MVNRSILCNCGIEADNHHLLESIAACNRKITKLMMYFTINLAFTNYLDILPNLKESLTLITDRTHYEQPLPIHLNIPHYDNSLTNRPSKLKEFLSNYIQSTNDKEIFDLQKKAYNIHIFTLKEEPKMEEQVISPKQRNVDGAQTALSASPKRRKKRTSSSRRHHQMYQSPKLKDPIP